MKTIFISFLINSIFILSLILNVSGSPYILDNFNDGDLSADTAGSDGKVNLGDWSTHSETTIETSTDAHEGGYAMKINYDFTKEKTSMQLFSCDSNYAQWVNPWNPASGDTIEKKEGTASMKLHWADGGTNWINEGNVNFDLTDYENGYVGMWIKVDENAVGKDVLFSLGNHIGSVYNWQWKFKNSGWRKQEFPMDSHWFGDNIDDWTAVDYFNFRYYLPGSPATIHVDDISVFKYPPWSETLLYFTEKDFSAYNKIRLWVKGDGTTHGSLQIGLNDETDTQYVTVENDLMNTEWHEVEVSLSEFDQIDLTEVEMVLIRVVENSSNPDGVGSVYVDDITITSEICTLTGDYPPCGEVILDEVVDFINLWAQGQAELGDVIALINAWASE